MKSIFALSSGVGLLVLASTVLAQETGASSDAGALELEEIVVTGSHAIRDVGDSPTPLTVASAEQLQLTPSSIPDALNKIPQFAGSTTNVGAGNGAGSGRSNVFTGNFLNLRSLGAIRTLILLDGHRVGPTALNGQVDTNTLPQMLVKNVDIVTGGVSAVYGSDAVSGVVNFVLDKEFKGLKVNLQGGTSERGDAQSWRAGLAGGFDLFDNGHVLLSFEHYDNKGISSSADRAYARSIPAMTATSNNPALIAGSQSNPYVLTPNARVSTAAFGGLATTGPTGLIGQQFVGSPATLTSFNAGTATGTTGTVSGGDGAYYTHTPLIAPTQTNQGFGRFEYKLTDNLSAYVQAGFGESSNDGFHSLSAAQTVFRIYSGNPYLPASAQTALNAAPATPFFSMGRILDDLSPDATLDQTTRSVTGTAGLTGKLFEKYTWDVYYSQSEARIKSVTHNNINYSHLFAALDAVKDPNNSNNIVCNVSTNPTNAALYPGCQPLNLFGVGNESAAAKAYIYGDTSWVAYNKTNDVAATINGEPFSTWAGPVSLSLTGEYRDQKLIETADANSLLPTLATNTPIRMDTSAAAFPTLAWAYPTETNSQGKGSVWEVGTEVLVPLLEDLPFAKKLSFNGAFRYTDYSTSGTVNTWKLGLVYQPFDQLRFRVTSSSDIRAPSLSDLFKSTGTTSARVADPVSGLTQTVNVVSSGNPNLVPEVARTYTAGLVFEPSWLPQFALSIDYFQTRISNAIGTVAGNDPSVLAECKRTAGTSPACVTISRATPTSFPSVLYSQTLNLAQLYTRGFDVEASYRIRLADLVSVVPGDVNVRVLYSYQPVLKTQTFATSPVIDAAGASGLSSSRITGVLGYKIGSFTTNLQERYYSPQKRSGDPSIYYADPQMPSIAYTDVDFSYDFDVVKDYRLQTFVNVANAFDRQPRINPSVSRGGIPGTGSPVVPGDDPVGRYYTAGFRLRY
jgi:iron complex outermembrane receptor protein